jgi:putative DNA primase/helicase
MPGVVDFLRGFFPVRSREPSARPGADRAASIQTFQPVGLQDFLALEVPPREFLLAPILPERSLSMLYAPRGIGKSWLGLSIGLAVASGGPVLHWHAPRPRRVLFVDGEMVLSDLQVRLNSILAGLGTEIPNDGFRVLAADHSELGINLGSAEGQQELERHLAHLMHADA